MKVKQSELCGLLVALGVDTAVGWDAATMAAKANQGVGISRYREGDAPIADEGAAKLYERIVDGQAKGQVVEVAADAEPKAEPEPAPKGKKDAAPKNGKKAKPKSTPRPVGGHEGYVAWQKRWKTRYAKTGMPITEKSGVTAVVVDILQEAGRKNKPLTKAEVSEEVQKRHPDRDTKKTDGYVRALVPGRLNGWYHQGVERVRREDKQYAFLIPGGKPTASKNGTAAPVPPVPEVKNAKGKSKAEKSTTKAKAKAK